MNNNGEILAEILKEFGHGILRSIIFGKESLPEEQRNPAFINNLISKK